MVHPVYSTRLLMMDRKLCPKHVKVYSKNKFEKLVHLVGFIIRIYHDARSSERQTQQAIFRGVLVRKCREWD